jgi:cytochrome P450
MAALTLEIAGKTLLGFDTRGETDRVSDILDVAMAHFSKEFHSWHVLLPAWAPTPTRNAFRRAVAELDRMIYAVIARCRAQDGAADHLLARLITARGENGEALTDQQIRDEAVTMLLAGHETTALTLSYAAYSLAAHPQVSARLRDEVDRVLGTRPPAIGDLAELPYLDAVLRESLRLYPPAFVVGRETTRAIEVAGYVIPRGSEVLTIPWSVHRNPRLYPDPERFDPERWLAPDPARARFAYFPFGGGPRVCIGNHFAMMEAALALAILVQRWELHAVPDFQLRFAPAVTLRPAEGGIPIRLRRRTTSASALG